MKATRLALLIALALLSSPALAQQQQPAPDYVPITLQKTDFDNLLAYLGEQPARIANPMIQFFVTAQQRAVAEKAAAEKAVADKPKN